MRDLVRIQLFAFGKRARRTAPDFSNERAQVVPDDDLAELLVARVQRMQVVVVEEMAKRSMADVMHEGGHPQEFFDVIGRGRIRSRIGQERVEVTREAASHMHGADGMHEARMFGRGINPAGALELVDLPEALHPGRVDQILFRPLVRIRLARGHREGDILVNGISDEGRAFIGSIGRASGELPCHRAEAS